MMRKIVVAIFLTGALLADLHAQESYIWVFLNTNPLREELSEEETADIQRRHMENIMRLAKEDKLLVAGPFNGGGGIFVMNTADLDQAKEWVITDPAIRAGRFNIEMFTWTSRIGRACLADENASMAEHTFVRYVPHITKFNVQQSPRLYLEHDRYLEKNLERGNVLTEGIFDNNDGGIVIFDEEPDRSVIMEDPTVVEGIFIPEIRTIWLADGSFCKD